MPRKRNPDRDKARTLWESEKGRSLVSIAEELGLPENRIRKWKCEDKWERGEKGALRNERTERSVSKKLIARVEKNENLNDKQKLFCLLYVKSFNATRSYQRAYGCSYETALTKGPASLKREQVQMEVQRLKAERNLAIMADAEDVVMLHMRIAFADLGDFVEWGRAEVPVMAVYGPVQVTDPETGDKVTLMKEVNDVRFRESAEVDGQLVSEVKLGRDGASIKLVDRQKSLDFLARYFEMNPMDQHKKAFDNAKLEMERRKQGDGDDMEDDGFIDALNNSVKEVWRDEAEGDLPV